MFTGIIERTGRIIALEPRHEGLRLTLECGELAQRLVIGASIAVNGVCLTAIEIGESHVVLDLVEETLERTNLRLALLGLVVNLELPMGVSQGFDGHMVQGHVDGQAELVKREALADGSLKLGFRLLDGKSPYVVEKGSVTIEGVSLTVAGIENDQLWIAIIPHTAEVTTLGHITLGHRVNIEYDVIAKYVEKQLKAYVSNS